MTEGYKEVKCNDKLPEYVGRIIEATNKLLKTRDVFETTVLLEQIIVLSEAGLNTINHK